MASNGFLPLALQSFARGEIDWEGDPLRVYLCSASHLHSDALQYVDDLTNVVADGAVSGASVDVGGILDMDDMTITGLDLGETATQIYVAQDFGTPATDRLILYFANNNDGIPVNRVGDGAAWALLVNNDAGRLARL